MNIFISFITTREMEENVIKVQFWAINKPIISAFIQVRNITYRHKVCVSTTFSRQEYSSR